MLLSVEFRRAEMADREGKAKGQNDTELMSDTGWNATTLKGTDGDGEGLVKQGDASTFRHTVELDERYDCENGSRDFGERLQSRNGQRGW